MDRYLLDGQEKCLKDEAELEKALKHYEDTDRWYFPRANEIYAKGVDNTPLFYGDYMRSISATCSEELFEECVKSTGIFLKVPDTTVVNLSPKALIYQGFRALFLYKKMKYFIKIT